MTARREQFRGVDTHAAFRGQRYLLQHELSRIAVDASRVIPFSECKEFEKQAQRLVRELNSVGLSGEDLGQVKMELISMLFIGNPAYLGHNQFCRSNGKGDRIHPLRKSLLKKTSKRH